MASRYKTLWMPPTTKSLQTRRSRTTQADLLDPAEPPTEPAPAGLAAVLKLWVRARLNNKPVLLFLGGHAIKCGLSRILTWLIRNNWVTHVAGNGAVMVHDYELSLYGHTSECVAETLPDGSFGMWQELVGLDTCIAAASHNNCGLGEQLGRDLASILGYTATDNSVLATGYQQQVPVTIHPLLGADVYYPLLTAHRELGQVAATDFRILAASLLQLQTCGGLFVCAGSAVHGPEVYLKALSYARNVGRQLNREFVPFDTAVFDLQPRDHDDPAVTRDTEADAGYYYRPWKTILQRSLLPGGTGYYVQGDLRQTLHHISWGFHP